MKYLYRRDIQKISPNTPIWACAYKESESNKSLILNCKPVRGEITEDEKFIEYKSNGRLSRKIVYADSRKYADTYEECVELYNSLVQERIDGLLNIISYAKKDFIDNTETL